MAEPGFDYEAAQHQDRLILQVALLSQLAEVHALVAAYSDRKNTASFFTWLKEEDVRNIAAGCGLYNEYIQVIQPKPEKEHEHANR